MSKSRATSDKRGATKTSDDDEGVEEDAGNINKIFAKESFDIIYHLGEYSRVESSYEDYSLVEKFNILSFALASDARDTHTPVTDRWDCPPPPPALLTQDSMPRERRHLAGGTREGGSG